jgi:hypothetical protein
MGGKFDGYWFDILIDRIDLLILVVKAKSI